MPNEKPFEREIALKPKMFSKSNRDLSLDYLRGIAVFLMILAHAIHFFHDGTNEILRFWEGVGNTLCFTTFLFVSGAVTTLAYLKENVDWKKKSYDILKRTAYLLIGYYTIAFVASVPSFSASGWLLQIVKILSFTEVPGFTEFIIPFLFLSISTIFLHKFYKVISKRFSFAVVAGILTFFIGSVLFTIYAPEPYSFWKALFVGSEGVYRFPILQYFPIFALGLWWGNSVNKVRIEGVLNLKSSTLGIFAILIYALLIIITKLYQIPFLDPLNRWPPSVGFLSIGIAFIAFSRSIIKNLEKTKILDPINRFFIYIGQDAFDMFLFSTLILLIYQQVWGQKYVEWQITIVLFGVLMSLSMLASSVNSLNSPSLFRKGTDIFTPYQRLFKKRFMILSIAMVIVVFGNLKIPVYSDVAGTMVSIKDLEIVEPLAENVRIPWWNNEYGQYQQVSISNPEVFTSINKDEILSIKIDHKTLVSLGKSTESGEDLTVTYFNPSNAYERELLETTVIDPNQAETTILFKAVNRIYPQAADNRYFLYYENIFIGDIRKEFTNPYELVNGTLVPKAISPRYEVTFGNEVKYQVTTEVSSKWIIKDPKQDEILRFTAEVNNGDLVVNEISYTIVGENFGGEMEEAYPGTYLAEINLEEFKSGAYEVIAIVGNKPNEITSQISRFVISEPIYISWTIDWEGYNENPDYLSQMAEITEKYDVPLTHFFNPRIYITESVTQAQRDYMTDWVKNRRDELGEAIGLHLHMHKDMVADAGVEPKDAPRWGRYKDADGQDVLTTEYSYEEVKKIIGWGIDKFEENGLGTPKMYRAGGWMADMDVLNALEDYNFWLDTSGRKKDSWWSSFPYWNLESTTQPYLISESDQNSSKAPNLNLWEFPNNGGDTTAFEAEASIRKLKDNYSGGIVEEKKLVTFLSHPRFFNVDAPRMETILEYLESFRDDNDSGPVVFITLEEAYEIWTE